MNFIHSFSNFPPWAFGIIIWNQKKLFFPKRSKEKLSLLNCPSEVIKLHSCSNKLSMNFPLLIKIKMLKITIFLALKLSEVVFILLTNVKMPLNIYEQDKFHAQLS